MEVQNPDKVSVTINNWDKFNGRKDVKHPSWFRVEVSLLDDPDFYDFTHEEFKAWLYIMARACRANSSTISVNFRHAEATARITRAGMLAAIEKLVQLQIVHADVTDTLRARDGHVTDTLRDRQTDMTDKTGQTSTREHERVTSVIAPTEVLPAKQSGKAGKGGKSEKPESATRHVWDAYSSAYFVRYGIEPARSAKLNSQITQLVRALGEEDAPHVARFYVESNDAWYVRQRHDFGSCLSQAQKLRTDWKLGATVSMNEARSLERRDEISRGWGLAAPESDELGAG